MEGAPFCQWNHGDGARGYGEILVLRVLWGNFALLMADVIGTHGMFLAGSIAIRRSSNKVSATMMLAPITKWEIPVL